MEHFAGLALVSERRGLAVSAAGCWMAAEDPLTVAEAFWRAGQERDLELARSYVSADSKAQINDSGDAAPFGDITLSDPEIDGDEATVETLMIGVGEQDLEIAFQTALVMEDGAWKIDLDRTMGEMTKSLLGVSMSEMMEGLGETMGDAVGEAVGSLVEGLAEGMQTAADSLRAKSERRR